MTTSTPSLLGKPQCGARTIFNVTSGNFLEMYDFMVFGYYPSSIAHTFFPSDDPFASLMLTLMAIGTLTIACVPGYATLGAAAPVLIILGRLLQGFSAGVELGGVSIYLAEVAPKDHKGFYVSWQSGSQQIAVVFAALLRFSLNLLLAKEQVTEWG